MKSDDLITVDPIAIFKINYTSASGSSAEERLDRLREEMAHYLAKSRYPYVDTCKHKDTSDLILDGCSPLEVM
jgi:hypothetical protein